MRRDRDGYTPSRIQIEYGRIHLNMPAMATGCAKADGECFISVVNHQEVAHIRLAFQHETRSANVGKFEFVPGGNANHNGADVEQAYMNCTEGKVSV